MKYSCLLFFIFIFTNGFSQSKKIWILDSLTHNPIYDVLVHTPEGNFYSNSKGFITVDSSFSETIELIHSDYKTKVVKFTSSYDTIYLVKNPFILGEVDIIQQKKPHSFDIGYYNRSLFNNENIINNLCILAVYVPYSDTDTYINKILLRIKTRKYSDDYNVYLFESDSTGKPGEILYKKNIIVDSLKKEGVINVQNLNIKMPENGIFVGFENLKVYDFDDDSNFPVSMGVHYKYTDKIDNSKVYILIKEAKINPSKIWIPFDISLEVHFTPCFGLQVYKK